MVAHAVTSVKGGVTLARGLNSAHQDMTLREGTHLGEFLSVDESEIMSLTMALFEALSAGYPVGRTPEHIQHVESCGQ